MIYIIERALGLKSEDTGVFEFHFFKSYQVNYLNPRSHSENGTACLCHKMVVRLYSMIFVKVHKTSKRFLKETL